MTYDKLPKAEFAENAILENSERCGWYAQSTEMPLCSSAVSYLPCDVDEFNATFALYGMPG